MDPFGEIRITKLEPETAVAWEGEHARGTITLEVSGWGTKVSLTAEPMRAGGVDGTESETAGHVEREPGDPVKPEPVVDRIEAEPRGLVKPAPAADRVEPTQRPRWTRRMARAFRNWFSPPPLQGADPVARVHEPEPEQPPTWPARAATPEPRPVAPEPPPQLDDTSTAALDAALDSLGQAHHRPFSRA
jgi:hypothetical protein